MKARGRVLREIREIFAPYCFHKKDTVPIHKLESGDYGYSNVSKFTLTNRNIVIKQVYFNEMDQQRLNRLCSEYILLMRATGRYLNPPVGFIFNNPIIIATDEILNGNLTTAIKEDRLTPTEKTKIAMGVAYGMRRLHKMHIVHGDLKSKNVLLADDNRPLISDFGIGSIAHNLQAPIQYKVTDPYWCAPEVLRGAQPTEKSDVFSFGALLAELFNGAVPYKGAGCLAHVDDDLLPTNAPRMMQAVVKLCTSQNPSKRPDFRKIYRLFKNCICFFEGTDLDEIKREVQLIKADKHKSHERFHPLVESKLPSREEIRTLITKNDALNEQKRAQKSLAKSRMSIDVREARKIQLNRKRPLQTEATEQEDAQKTAETEKKTEEAAPKSSGLGGLSMGKSFSLGGLGGLSGLGVAKGLGLGRKTPLSQSSAKQQSTEEQQQKPQRPINPKFMKMGPNIKLCSTQKVSSPSPPIPQIPTDKNKQKTDEVKYTPRPNKVLARGVPLGLQTSYKGRISISDRFKTVDDVDGRNYLRLPRRARKVTHFAPTYEVAPKERLFRSTSSRMENTITIKPTIKESKKRMTRSLLCLTVLLKQGKISLPCFQKSEILPAAISLSKQVMPFIRP